MFLYKYILNSLPLLLQPQDLSSPFDSEDEEEIELGQVRGSRIARLSNNAQAHQSWVKHKSKGWYSLVAGAVAGGASVMFEKRANRLAIGQQLFVR